MQEELFQEKVIRVRKPDHHFTLLQNQRGYFLSVDADGLMALVGDVDDRAIWDSVAAGEFRQVTSGLSLKAEPAAAGGFNLSLRGKGLKPGNTGPAHDEGLDEGLDEAFDAVHGPEKLPSEYLRHFRQNGWVGLSCILAPDIVEQLEKVTCTDRYADQEFDASEQPLSQNSAVAKTVAEPVSLWLIRQYMQTDEIRLAHPPGLAILSQDDGERNVQGWHADYPYLWGITNESGDKRVPTPSGDTVLGVQRNVCISDFTKVAGATCFKLGSHTKEQSPPQAWGTGAAHQTPGYRSAHGLPYSGPDADVIEAPGGSIILYDARTWHRAGVNRTANKRAAMLQAMIPGYVMPFFDTSRPYKDFINSQVHTELTDRQRDEMRHLMVHHMNIPGRGKQAITVDAELTDMISG